MNRTEQIDAVAHGTHGDPFSVLGPHTAPKSWMVRTFQPQADAVELLDAAGERLATMRRVHAQGLFEARVPGARVPYRLCVQADGERRTIEDPYRFSSPLGDLDRHLLGEGAHRRLAEVLGAHPRVIDGIEGVHFAVWAPNARRVSVIGPFNDWDGRRHPMRLHPANGVWDIFVPAIGTGELYKLELLGHDGTLLPLKSDPLALQMEPPPGNASIVLRSSYRWRDADWMADRAERGCLNQAMSIYEVHLGSWRRRPDEGNRWLSYRELAADLVGYVAEMGLHAHRIAANHRASL